MRVLGVIPARGGSVGVKRKNIRLLGGKPLISYTIKEAHKSQLLTDVCVSTEDEEIASVAREYGANVPFVRPLHLAPDVPSEWVVEHALTFFEDQGIKYDAVMLLQPTSPFRSSSTIDSCIKILSNSNNLTSVLTGHNIEAARPEWMFRINENGKIEPYVQELNGKEREFFELTARQELETLYRPDGNIFLAKVDVFKETGALVTNDCGYFEPENIFEQFDIDTELELAIANFLAENKDSLFG